MQSGGRYEARFPAAGNRNGTSVNNAGSNGNYWSSSLNTDNPNNAWNLNFNSSDVNTNNNNRYNGQSVRPVTAFTMTEPLPFDITREKLLLDLYAAYKDARRRKRRKDYQLAFECNLEAELVRLRNEISERRYRPGPSKCFIIHDPKMREVFAAQFRDRIVHHLLYNYIAPFLESGFIQDSYSCIRGRGTHYGIKRLGERIRDASYNYSRPCYILKLDIVGYFMHINRHILLRTCLESLKPFHSGMDYPIVEYLLKTIIQDNPVEHCLRIGPVSDWDQLPDSKSLFCSPGGCGLPIGNLTSQLFSNVYLNILDQRMVALTGPDSYGRYVDDAYVVGRSRVQLKALIPKAEAILEDELGLKLNRDKVSIYSAYRGVEFLGAYLKPFRNYLSNHTLHRMNGRLKALSVNPPKQRMQRINSYLGITSHYRAYAIRKKWIEGLLAFSFDSGYYRNGILKYTLNQARRKAFRNK